MGVVVKAMLLYALVHLKKNSRKFLSMTSTSISLHTPSCKGSQVNWKSVCQSWVQLCGCASCVFILGPRLKEEQVPWGGSSHGDVRRASRNTRRLLRFSSKLALSTSHWPEKVPWPAQRQGTGKCSLPQGVYGKCGCREGGDLQLCCLLYTLSCFIVSSSLPL